MRIKLVCHLSRGCPCWAGGATRLPELADVLAEFLTGGGPVCLDAVAELGHVALQIELALLQPRDVQFSARCAALELAVDILVIVTDNPVLISNCSGPTWGMSYLVMIPVVLRPSVLWVTRNMPFSFNGV
jgi:hypothetical protein